MNILLVYPAFPTTFWSFRHALKFIHKRASTPPLGLLTVAALLPPDVAVRLVDLNIEPLRPRDLAWADYVFLSAMKVQQASACAVLRRCHEAGVKVVAGGPLFTHEHESFPDVDHFVLNEAELTLPAFLHDLRQGTPQRLYQSSALASLPDSPIPRFELARLGQYASMGVQFSRGCPFNCEFCDVTALFGRKPRVKSVAQVLAELDRLMDLGWRGSVFFVDDNLIGNRVEVRDQLLPALADWQRRRGPVPFYSQVSINVADDPVLVRRLAEAGFDTVFIGIETPDPQALTACHKLQNTRRDLLADVRRLQAAGIQVQGGFIVGFDGEDPSIFDRQVRFIQASGIVTAMVGVLQALVGTALYRRLAGEARLLGPGTGDNVSQATNFRTTMDSAELRRGYARLLQRLYTPRAFHERLRVFLRHYQPPLVHTRLRWMHIRAFLRANLSLGILGRERLQYWRTLFWALLHRPRLLGTAVTLSILGHHFRRVCQPYFHAVAGREDGTVDALA